MKNLRLTINTLIISHLLTLSYGHSKNKCDEILANGKDVILQNPAIHAYVKIACPKSIRIEEKDVEAAQWFNFLSTLDKGKSWNKDTFKFDERFALQHLKLYDFALQNNLVIKAGFFGSPITESWELLAKQSKQKQNKPSKGDYIRFLIRNYPCSDGSATEEIAFQLAEELKTNPKLVFESILAEQAALNTSSPTSSCGQKAKADSSKDKAYYSNMILNSISELVWLERANIPRELVDQFAQLSKEFGNNPVLAPFQQFYEAYNEGLNLELVPHLKQ